MATLRFIATLLITLTLSRAVLADPASLSRAGDAIQGAGAAPVSTPALTRAGLEAWLDGFVPGAMRRGDLAGAVVVAVKDGQVLLAKGYGLSDVARRTPVDPSRTLFRPGSISKLFTWTAVMQQVESGKLDLDRDVNAYLDFRIPSRGDGPITLRDLLTHTPGFEEKLKGLIVSDAKLMEPLGEAARRGTPRRVYAAGTTPAYSNYGAGLAGYIVQRMSGQSFAAYIENHIFGPLGIPTRPSANPRPPACGWICRRATSWLRRRLNRTNTSHSRRPAAQP